MTLLEEIMEALNLLPNIELNNGTKTYDLASRLSKHLKQGNPVASIDKDNKTYYRKRASNDSITIKCEETKEERTFTKDDIEFKLQTSYYRRNLDNDKWKYLFHLKSLIQNARETDNEQPIDFENLFYPEDEELEIVKHSETEAMINYGDNTIILNSDGTYKVNFPIE